MLWIHAQLCVCMYRYRCTPCLIYSSALKLSVRKSTSLKSRHFEQLLKLFEQFGTPDKRRYLFLGGYVNKGPRSLDTTCLLFLYKAISGRPDFPSCFRGFSCSHGPKILKFSFFDSMIGLPGSSAS